MITATTSSAVSAPAFKTAEGRSISLRPETFDEMIRIWDGRISKGFVFFGKRRT